jgi:hypothetical protein
MKKDAYYFPHFSNARHDRKLKRVIKDLGIEGYGIYFMVLEVLRDQQDFKYPVADIDLLADEFGTSESKLSVVIKNYDLFEVDEQSNFFSTKQALYLQPYIERTEKARNMARKRWDNVKSQPKAIPEAMPEHSLSNARKGKESKVKESKETSVRDLIFEKWFRYKREKRQAYTPTGVETLIKTWSEFSDSQLEQIVDTSISNNYSGLFAPKNTTTSKQSTEPKAPRTTITIPDNY